MTNAPQTGLSHPLVVAYLGDLDRALASADPQERLDTITAVTEHLTDALGGDVEPTTTHVRAVLDELGSVEKIAEAATPATPVSPASAPATEEKPRGGWIEPALLATAIVSLVLPFLGALLAIGCIVTAAVLLRHENPRRSLLIATIAVSIVTLVLTAVLALGAFALTSFSTPTVSESVGPIASSQAAVMPTTGP